MSKQFFNLTKTYLLGQIVYTNYLEGVNLPKP